MTQMALVDAYCRGCDLDRSGDPALGPTTRTPCPACGTTALNYMRQTTDSATATASVSFVMTPGDQARTWELRWRTIQFGLAELQAWRQGGYGRADIEAAERELLDFFVTTYHLKDALIKEGVAPSSTIEKAITASPTLALLADLANLDKHHQLDPKKHPPRSGHAPTVVMRQAESDDRGWRLKSTIEHNGKYLDGLNIARDAVAAWEQWLQGQGLI